MLHELHMIVGAIRDTWPAILLGLASLAYIMKCRRAEYRARKSAQRIAREVAYEESIAAIPATVKRNDAKFAKAFGSGR